MDRIDMAAAGGGGVPAGPGGADGDGSRPQLAGVEVREDDIEPQRGLHLIAVVFRVSGVVILLLALWQFAAWWLNRPPGGVGIGLLVGDTIRLIVFSGLLWAAGDLANLMIKTHHDIRAGRILLARQTYMMRQLGIAKGALPMPEPHSHVDRRGVDAADTVVPPDDSPLR
jgi:hypothetical protein